MMADVFTEARRELRRNLRALVVREAAAYRVCITTTGARETFDKEEAQKIAKLVEEALHAEEA